jgi:hypothetical protein
LITEPEQLATLARRYPVAAAFFSLVAEVPRLRRESPVDLVVERTGAERRDVVRFLRELEALKAGRLVVGRRKQKTRFVWSDRFDVVATVKKALILQGKTTAEPDVDVERTAADTTSTLFRHRYRLRPSLEVELALPTDLTQREAERLADFLKTLPFETSK